MERTKYANVRDLHALPSFHDAELVRIEHGREDRELELGFRRVNGETASMLFGRVLSLRIVDFAEQNVVSRILLPPKYSFTTDEVRTYVGWVRSFADSKPVTVSEDEAARLTLDLTVGNKALCVLEPSCGAELVVLCESAWLWAEPDRPSIATGDRGY